MIVAVSYFGVSGRLNSEGISIQDDFHCLTSSQVDFLLILAKEQSYRKPANANGSTARMYFQALLKDYIKWKKNQ